MASVLLKDVRKDFKEQTAVKDVNLEIDDREFVVIVGPSGCGKTTTLRMIAGLEEVTEGDIFIGSRRVNDVPPRDRNIAMVFQNYALYPNMTVYDNMAFGLKLRKEDKYSIREKVRAAAEMLDIERYLDRKPAKLSGGERQRVAIGRALVREPEVFLMDEPLSNLDAKLRNTMRAQILKLHGKLSATIVYVTHDQVEAMTLGDRIVVMRDGVVQQVDTPENIYGSPLNKYVAEFMGSPPMNFLPAVLVREEGRVTGRLTGSGVLIELPEDLAAAPGIDDLEGKEIVIGIRPEHVVIRPDPGAPNRLETVLDVVEKMGPEEHVHLRLGPMEVIARTAAVLPSGSAAAVGINLPPERLFVFDAASGRNVMAQWDASVG